MYELVNRVMFDPSQHIQGAAVGEDLGADIRTCAPYIKFLDTALERLPERFVYRGRVQRGVKWVFPSLDQHDPEAYFRTGATMMWYEFKSSSTKRELMSQPRFCGHAAGPRTIFTIDAVRAYSIEELSTYGPEEAGAPPTE